MKFTNKIIYTLTNLFLTTFIFATEKGSSGGGFKKSITKKEIDPSSFIDLESEILAIINNNFIELNSSYSGNDSPFHKLTRELQHKKYGIPISYFLRRGINGRYRIYGMTEAINDTLSEDRLANGPYQYIVMYDQENQRTQLRIGNQGHPNLSTIVQNDHEEGVHIAEQVFAAGEIVFESGIIKKINDKSGAYHKKGRKQVQIKKALRAILKSTDNEFEKVYLSFSNKERQKSNNTASLSLEVSVSSDNLQTEEETEEETENSKKNENEVEVEDNTRCGCIPRLRRWF